MGNNIYENGNSNVSTYYSPANNLRETLKSRFPDDPLWTSHCSSQNPRTLQTTDHYRSKNGANSRFPLPINLKTSNDPSYKLFQEIKGLIDEDPFIKSCIPNLLARPNETFLNDLRNVLESFISTERSADRRSARIVKETITLSREVVRPNDSASIEKAKQILAEKIAELEMAFKKLAKFETVFNGLSKLNHALVPRLKMHLRNFTPVDQKENLFSSPEDPLSGIPQNYSQQQIKKSARFAKTVTIRSFCSSNPSSCLDPEFVELL